MVHLKSIEKVSLFDTRKRRFSPWFLPLISGTILIFGYPPFNVPVLPVIGLVPLFFFLSSFGRSPKRCFLAGLITGFIFFAFVIGWGFSVFPSGLADIKSEIINALGIFLIWLTLAAFLAVFVGLFSLGYSVLARKRIWDILLIPSLWIAVDYLRVLALGVFVAGPESLLGAHWTLGNLAYGFAQNQVIRSLAGVGGIYLVSFLVVLVNSLLFYFLRGWSKNRGRASLSILSILFLVAVSYFFALPARENKAGQSLRIASVQTEFPSSLFLPEEAIKDKSQTQTRLLEEVLHYPDKVDVVILPEGSNFLKWADAASLKDLFEGQDVLVIDSADEEGGKFAGSFFSPERGILAKYEKMLLIPYSNYLPYTFEVIAKAINEDWLREVKQFKDMRRGGEFSVPDVPGYGKVGFLFCSEAISPGLHRKAVEMGAQIFLNAGSLAFSRGSEIIDSQTLAMLQFRAAENGRYLVRATNYGRSYIIDSRGNVVKITDDFGNQVIFGEVGLISEKTLYTRYGDLVLTLAFLVILLSLAVSPNRLLPLDKKR